MERDSLIQPSPSFQQLRLAGEHHEQPHKQLIRPPIARPVLAGERKKERRKEREKRSPRGLEKRKKLQRKEGRGDTGHQGGGSAHAPSLLFLFTHHLPLTPHATRALRPRVGDGIYYYLRNPTIVPTAGLSRTRIPIQREGRANQNAERF